MPDVQLYRHYLKSELARRCEKNPSYSLRAFAKAIEVDAGTLSRILNGQQALSFKMAQKVVAKLDLDPEQETNFFRSLARQKGLAQLGQQSQAVDSRGDATESKAEYKGEDLRIEYYRLIADWYHHALMELTHVKGFKPDIHYISRELGISQTEARLALDRLVHLNLLAKKNGKLVKVQAKHSTTDRNVTTPALRKCQKQFLEKAIYSLENDPLEERNHTNIIMAGDSSKIEAAKRMIREFQMALCNFLESGKRDRVFNLSVALFPVQKNNHKEKES